MSNLAKLIELIERDPNLFLSALVNTIDTHAEDRDIQRMLQEDREEWAVEFILRHDQYEPAEPSCSVCQGPLVLLGQLGIMTFTRCRNCGLTHSKEQ